ncbi:hypothetical protein GU926_15840 [Nibribacter ruber]|uniref:Nuclear transport factor 2 family protein n=1 Tax=Nibribacter ruber TaxID=2698458 RepID=A0A6P1P334_9BACT|nr:nuclear transport factor 2 family protein [Nibribacter ruber]QHL88816.1 hypothetical protein GU926_15840 [Nibribacter ruber]
MRHFLLFLTLAVLSFTASAQTKKAAPASQDAKAVEAAVVKFFDGMRQSDSTLSKSVLAPGARLQSVAMGKDGVVQLRETPMQKFIEMVGQKHEKMLDEGIWNVQVHLDGDFATLWCDYALYVGDTFSHCGVDAFQLYRSQDGWKIFSITDTRRKEGCDMKAAQASKAKK